MSHRGEQDTIAAIATPPGEGGIGIVRLSGPEALAIAGRLFHSGHASGTHDQPSHTLRHGNVVDPVSGNAVDEVLMAVFRAPHSYTGEDVAEIHGHGGPRTQAGILDLCLAQGARLADPGEFTRRAFLNGRMDLVQAEAVLDLIQARTEAAQRTALAQLQGRLSKEIHGLRDRILSLVARLEASLDFPEDVEAVEDSEQDLAIKAAEASLDGLLAHYAVGRLFREGLSVVLVGRPNVGKSSLFNALLAQDRAIVTPVPGTTRDVVEAEMELEGMRVCLSDTAGLHEGPDAVEREGVRRTRERLHGAEMTLLVLDASESLKSADMAMLGEVRQGRRGVLVVNKVDLPPALDRLPVAAVADGWPVVEVSAKTGQGLDQLQKAMSRQALQGKIQREGILVTRLRHRTALEQARAALGRGRGAVAQGLPPELVAVDLRAALDHLGELVGVTTTEDLLDRIFGEFCLGK